MIPTLFSGSVLADGLLIDREFLGEGRARERVMDLVGQGATTHAIPGAYAVCFARPRRVRVVEALGAPFLTRGQVRTTVDLPLDELARLSPAGGLVFLAAGAVRAVALGPATQVQPSAWIDLGLQPLVLRGLGAPAVEPERAAPPRNLRSLLEDHVPPADEALVHLPHFQVQPGGPSLVIRWLQSIVVVLRGIVSRWEQARRRGTEAHDPSASTALAPRKPSRFAQWLDALWVRLALLSRLSSLLQERQWSYMENLLSAFARRDWEDALRRAIPLAKANELGASQVSFATPKPRSDLTIRPGAHAAGGSIGFGPNLYAHLRALYQKAFEALDARGEHERAAFVLAELLGADAEAAAYLERHGQARLAAELAEARKLPAELVVRQWLVAGDLARAVAVARKRAAFPVAIAYLEKRDRELSRTLSLAWAEVLAEAGDYLAAATLASPIPGAEVLAQEWLRRAIAVGGTVTGKALGLRMGQVEPLTTSERTVFDSVVAREASDGPASRQALGRVLARAKLPPWAAALGRAVVRALATDAANSLGADSFGTARSLAEHLGNRPLLTDLEILLRSAPPAHAFYGFDRTIEAQDTGARSILDVAALPEGRVLVALGEQGLWLLHRTGKVAARFDVPAYQLVVSVHGDRALALAPRGDATRLTRVDLLSRRTETWTEALLDRVAPTFDGETFAVARADKVYIVDALDSRWTALETYDLGGATPLALGLDGTRLCLVVRKGQTYFQRHERPGGTLRVRVEVAQPADGMFAVTPQGGVACTAVREGPPAPITTTEGFFQMPSIQKERSAFVRLATGAPLGVAIGNDHVAGACREDDGVKVVLRRGGPGLGVGNVDLTLRGAGRVALGMGQDAFWVGDDRGRLFGVDLSTMREILDLRL